MKTLILVGMVVFLSAFTGYGDIQIKVDPGNYIGDYRIDSGAFTTGTNTFPISGTSGTSALHYFWNTSSCFQFNVKVDGTNAIIDRTSIKPWGCAKVDPKNPCILQLRTVPITIDPTPQYGGRAIVQAAGTISTGTFPGVYFMSDFNRLAYPGEGYYGVGHFDLVPGLSWQVDDGSYVGGSSFQFFVNSENSGNVIPKWRIFPHGVATPSGNTLKFNTSPVVIETGSYNHPYIVLFWFSGNVLFGLRG
jgi:hypothetical protein